MRIETLGTIAVSKTNTVIKEIVADIMERANIPQNTKFKVKDLSCNISFMVDGVENGLTVTHNGNQEMFTVMAKIDSKGNVEKAVNNEKESFIDDYTKSVITGEEKEYKEFIKSEYDAKDLVFVNELCVEDKKEVVYKHEGLNTYVLQYFVGDKLVGECTTKEIPQEHLQEGINA